MIGIRKFLSVVTRNHFIDRIESSAPTLYLTFDDGPHPVHTAPLLDLLAQHQAQGTFFLIGKSAEAHPEVVRALLTGGHLLANHSFSHIKREKLSYREQREGIDRTDQVLTRFDGRDWHYFRPPWGDLSVAQLMRCFLALDRVALWSRNSMDYRDDASAIIDQFRKVPPVPGDIILFHDDGPTALDALSELLPEWRQSGLEFRALPQ